ncbi:MAG TPA: DUF4160 domain-containing protein [Longimicrobiaceae bacterium]|nr:DUF4160 domain-containing protein [Longimicrobiaceae bacterium]
MRGVVGRVDSVEWAGWQCWFWSQDHREPHFHAKSPGEWEVRIFFGEDPPYYDVLWQVSRIPKRKLKDFLALVAENRQALYKEWEVKVEVVDP